MVESIQLSDNIIGKGAYGVVKKGYTLDNTECAVKIIHSELLKGSSKAKFLLKEMVLHEAKVMSKLAGHPNIVQLIGLHQPSNEGRDYPPYLVMEFCHKGSLRSNIKDPAMHDLLIKLHILLDTAQGLKYIHFRGFLHGDLTPQNIVITKHRKAKIGDFGAIRLSNSTNLTDSIPGTPGYMGPEVQGVHPYNEMLDIYSFGCVMLYTFSGKELTGDIKKWLECLSLWPLLQELAEQCLESDPQERPTAGEICQRLSCYIANIEKWLEYFSQWPLLQELANQCLHYDPRKGPPAGKTNEQLCYIMQTDFDAVSNTSPEKLHLEIIQNGYETTHPGISDVLSSLVHSFGISEMMVPRHINKSCAVKVLCEQLCKPGHDGHTVSTLSLESDCTGLSNGYDVDKPFNSNTNACYDETDIAVAMLGIFVCCLLYSLQSLFHTSFDDTCSKQKSDGDDNQVIEVQNTCSASDDVSREDELFTSSECSHEELVACELYDNSNDGKSSVVNNRRLSFHNGCDTRLNIGIKYLLLALFVFFPFISCSQNSFPHFEVIEHLFTADLNSSEYIPTRVLLFQLDLNYLLMVTHTKSIVHATNKSSMLLYYQDNNPQCKLEDYNNNKTLLYNSLTCDYNSTPNYSPVNANLSANEMNADHLHLESFAAPNLFVSFLCPHHMHPFVNASEGILDANCPLKAEQNDASSSRLSSVYGVVPSHLDKQHIKRPYCKLQDQDTSITSSTNSSSCDNSLLLNITVNPKLVDDGKGFLFKTAARIPQLVMLYPESQSLPAKHTNPLDYSFTCNQTMLLYSIASLLVRNDYTCTIKFNERIVPNTTKTLELHSEHKVSGPLHYNNGSYNQPYREIQRNGHIAINFYEVLNAVITFTVMSVVSLTKPLLLHDNLIVNAVIMFKFSIEHFPNIKNTYVNFLYWLHNTFIIITLHYINVKWLFAMVLASECTKRKLQLWTQCCTFYLMHYFKIIFIRCLKNIASFYNNMLQPLWEMTSTSDLACCSKYRHSMDKTLYQETSIEPCDINSNTAAAPTRQNINEVATLQKKHWIVAINSTEETSGKHDEIKCVKELDKWLFQQNFLNVTDFCSNAWRMFSLLLLSLRKLDIHQCKQLKSMEENKKYHCAAESSREYAITVFRLCHYKCRNWHLPLFTQHGQVISHQHCLQYNTYSSRMQVLALLNIKECMNQLLYNCQIGVSFSVKMVQVKVMQNKRCISFYQKFYNFTLRQCKGNCLMFLDHCNMLQIMTKIQEKRCSWFGASEEMLQVLHQSAIDLFSTISQLIVSSSHFEFQDDNTAFDSSFGLQDFQHSFPPGVTSINSHYTYGLDQSCSVTVASTEEDQHYQDRNQLSSNKHQNNTSVSKDQRKADKNYNTQHKHTDDSEGEREDEKDSNGSDRGCILKPALFNALSLLRYILPLLLVCLILLSLPCRSSSQPTTETEHHSCNYVIMNTPLPDVTNESICQLGWIGKNCRYNMLYPYIEPSVMVANARLSTTTQTFYQSNLHMNKNKQIGIVNGKPFTSLCNIAVLHNFKLLTPIKYQLKVQNLGFQCNVTVVLIIYGEQLQPVTLKVSRMRRLISLPQYCNYAMHFDWAKSTLQTRMLSYICSMLNCEVTAHSLYAGTNVFNHDLLCSKHELCKAVHKIFDQIYHHFHTETSGTSIQHPLLWCRTHNGTSKNTTVSYSLSERCGIFVQKMIQQLMTYPVHAIHNNENSSRNLHHKEHGSYHSNVANTKDFNPLYLLLLLQLLLSFIFLKWLSSGPHTSNDRILVNNRLTKEICILSINRKIYQFHAIFRRKPPIIIDVCKEKLCNYVPLLTRLQVSKCKTVYPRPAIGTYFKLYRETVVSKQGLILFQEWFDTICFDYKVSELTICCFIYLRARHSISDFHNVNRIMHRLMCNYTRLGRFLLFRIHGWIFHIENNILKHSTSELHMILIQWTSSNLHQPSRRYFYGLHYVINYGISELPFKTTISYCFQESIANTLGLQNTVLHSARTIPTLAKDLNIVEAFRPINIASGRTINYYSYHGIEDDIDMFDSWQLVIGHTILYNASGVLQVLPNEQHHEIIYGDNIIANFANENFDVAILPEQPELVNNYNDNVVVVSPLNALHNN